MTFMFWKPIKKDDNCSGSQGESNKMTPEFIGRMVYSLTSHLLNFAGTITRPVVLRP